MGDGRVLARVVGQAEGPVRVDRVQPGLLKLVGRDLVGEADAPPLYFILFFIIYFFHERAERGSERRRGRWRWAGAEEGPRAREGGPGKAAARPPWAPDPPKPRFRKSAAESNRGQEEAGPHLLVQVDDEAGPLLPDVLESHVQLPGAVALRKRPA